MYKRLLERLQCNFSSNGLIAGVVTIPNWSQSDHSPVII